MKHLIAIILAAASLALTSCSSVTDKTNAVQTAEAVLTAAQTAGALKPDTASTITAALAIVKSGEFAKLDADSLVANARLALTVAEQTGALTPDKAALVRVALSLAESISKRGS